MCQSHRSRQAHRGMNQSAGPLESISEAPAAGPLLPPAGRLGSLATSEHTRRTTCSSTSGDPPRLTPTRRIASVEQVHRSLQTIAGASMPAELRGLPELVGSFLPDFWDWETGNKSSSRGRGIRHHVPQNSKHAPWCWHAYWGVSSGHSARSLIMGNTAAAEEN